MSHAMRTYTGLCRVSRFVAESHGQCRAVAGQISDRVAVRYSRTACAGLPSAGIRAYRDGHDLWRRGRLSGSRFAVPRPARRAPAPVVADRAQPAHRAPDAARDSVGVAGGRHVPARRAGDPRGSGESRRGAAGAQPRQPRARRRALRCGHALGALQCLGPGETAPAHRHTPGAIRFVLTGTGVWTTVNGDRCDMGPGDLVLTPSWYWHDHTNSGDRAMFWFDGLDLPMVEALDAVFYEQYPEHAQPAAGHNRSGRRSRAIRPGTPRRGHIRAQRPRSRPRCLSTAGRTPTRNWAGWRGSGRKLPASARNSPTPRPAAACCPRWRARCTGWPPIGAAQRSGGPVTPSSSCSAARVAARSAAADWSGPRATCSWFPPGCPPRTDRESARTCSNCRTRPCCARSAYTAKRRFREAPGPDRPPG